MSNRHARAFDYVNRPYAEVRDALLADPRDVFRRATGVTPRADTDGGAALRARVGSFTVGHEVTIDVGAAATSRAATGEVTTKLPITWRAASNAPLFPTMSATLAIYPLSATETQLDLEGDYDPPLGVLGDALDALVLHQLAEASVEGLVRDLATYLRANAS